MAGAVWEPGFRPSNGTMGEWFRAQPQACETCTIDHSGGWHGEWGSGDSCPILMSAIVDLDGPTEWESRWVDDKHLEARCAAWRGPCKCVTPPEPPWPTAMVELPKPVPPLAGQLDIFGGEA